MDLCKNIKVNKEGIWLWKGFLEKKERALRIIKGLDNGFLVKLSYYDYRSLDRFYKTGCFLLFLHHDPEIALENLSNSELYQLVNNPRLR